MTDRKCYYCGNINGTGSHELRPYGPNGSYVCYKCITSCPEKEEAAKKEFGKQLDMADSVSGKAVLTVDGPISYIGKL
jgi:hypothetical protein